MPAVCIRKKKLLLNCEICFHLDTKRVMIWLVYNIMGDKLLLNFGAKFQRRLNCNVWREISQYNNQVKNPGV